MTTATDTDFQTLKDLITAENAVTQKQISDLSSRLDRRFAKLEQRLEVGFARVETRFAKIEGDMKELRSEIKALDTEFDEKTKNLDQQITSKEFINRGVSIGMTVTVVGAILLVFGKALFF